MRSVFRLVISAQAVRAVSTAASAAASAYYSAVTFASSLASASVSASASASASAPPAKRSGLFSLIGALCLSTAALTIPLALQAQTALLPGGAAAATTGIDVASSSSSANTSALLAAQNSRAAILLLGEQHDAPAHPALHASVVAALAAQGQLTALLLEMADTPARTDGLPKNATDAQAQAALGWRESAWPWAQYRTAIMAAVAAGVPVRGANLPRSAMQSAMKNEAYSLLYTPANWQKQLDSIRTGHCDMLPSSQWAPMARVQAGRDLSMAQTLLDAPQGGTAVLIAGNAHLDAAMAVPFHLKRLRPEASVQSVVWPAFDSGRDYCAEFAQQMKGLPPAAKP